jgi:phosphosulfolactate phosphohydrolase-like enzyme/GNAT superfamily N-acetyltransferase
MGSMKIQRATLETCAAATGVAVAVDVIRAYTTAAYGLAAGAREIFLTATVEEALALREEIPGALAMGEINGLRPPEFDLGNSPSALAGLDLAGRILIHRTSAGTQGAVRAARASALFGASFVVAGATARAIRALQPDEVTLIETGVRPKDSAEEDVAMADYLDALLQGQSPDPAPYLERAWRADTVRRFLDPAVLELPEEDIPLCLEADRFDFALRIERLNGRLVLRKKPVQKASRAALEQAAPYILRPPQPGDLGWVVQSHGRLYAEEYGWGEDFEALVAGIVADYARQHDPGSERCWIAEMDGENVGSVFVVKKSETEAKLRLLLVAPRARGLGLGRRLVEECILFSRQAGYRRLVLWTNSVLTAARHIYATAGFRLVESEPNFEFGHDLVSETWELDL